MKVKAGGRRRSWEVLPESVSMADDIIPGEDTQPIALNGSVSAPSLLSLDAQPQQDPPPQQDLDDQSGLPEPEADGNEADEDEADGDDEEELDGDGDGADDNAEERPKLDEGFYEIEAVRRKRVRKGQLQYLIKWRGWPETANTWEPMENLQSCSDVIEAFEEGIRSGKHRKRKRKGGILHTHVKKRHQRSPPVATYSSAGLRPRVGNLMSSTAIGNVNLADNQPMDFALQECNGDVNNGEMSKQANVENGLVNDLHRSSGRRNKKDYDPKLSELKTTTPIGSADRLAIQFQEVKDSEGNGHAEESPKVNSTENVQNTRSTGAKRRKSGSVKRFKQEPQLYDAAVLQNLTIGANIVSGGRMEILGDGYSNFAWENSNHKSNTDEPEGALRITKILKPIAYSASVKDDVQDVKVTFAVMRSDGMEVMVDNKFLKSNNPHLLINYYEQHLRYNPTS